MNQTSRDQLQNYIEVGYYVLYGLIIVMAFLVNPFFFFYYEEKEEDNRTTRQVQNDLVSKNKENNIYLFRKSVLP